MRCISLNQVSRTIPEKKNNVMEHSGEKIEFHEWDFAYGFKFQRVEERFDKLWK